jgi:hypothetical protein
VAADLTEGAGGDQWLQNLTVGVDQVYMLYVSNVSANSSSANITFSNTGILTCGFFLPVELLQFDAKAAEAHVDVLWTTVSETSSAWFNVQRSADGEHFTQIGRVNAAGNSVQTLDYSLKDAAWPELLPLGTGGPGRNSDLLARGTGLLPRPHPGHCPASQPRHGPGVHHR